MKTKKLLVLGASFIGSFLALTGALFLSAPNALAAARTWDGGGSDENFSTAANWSSDTAPVNGDSIVIPYNVVLSGCSDDVTLNNDLNAGTVTLAGVSFTGSKPADCYHNVIIAGNTLKSSADILGNAGNTASPRPVFQVAITATAAITIQSIDSTSSLAVGSNNVTVLQASFDGGVSGSGVVTIDGYSASAGGGGCSTTTTPSPFGGDSSSFTGSIIVQSDGVLKVAQQSTDAARFASSITKASDGNLSLYSDNGQNMSLATAMTINGGTIFASQLSNDACAEPLTNTTMTLSGNVTFTAATEFTLYDTNITFTGTVTGKDFVSLAAGGNGSITFPDNTSIDSPQKVWTINTVDDCTNYSTRPNNKNIVNVDCSGSIGGSVDSPQGFRGIVAGTGKVGHISMLSGGVIAPGQSPGCLSAASLTMVSGSAYNFEVGGTTECSGYDQIKVTDTVNLGSATLSISLYNGFAPAVGQVYKIVDNDGTDAITGTFSGLPEGASFNSGGIVYKISYVGGTGNDVVLTVLSAPGSPNTGFGLVKNNPAVVLAVTTLCALTIAAIAKKQSARKSGVLKSLL